MKETRNADQIREGGRVQVKSADFRSLFWFEQARIYNDAREGVRVRINCNRTKG